MAGRDLELLVRLVADTKQINKGVGQVNSSMSRFGSTIKTLGLGLGIGLGAKVAIGWLGDATQAASDLEQAQGKIRDVFGESATEVRRWASDADQFYRLSERQAAQAVGTIGSLAKGLGLAGEELAAVSTDLASLGEDLSAFGDVGIEDAVKAITSGLAGESEPLRRYGIDLRVARVEADALADGLGAASKAQKIYNSIVRQSAGLGITGAAARELETAAGRAAELSQRLANVQTRLGARILPLQVRWNELLLQGLENAERIGHEFAQIGDSIAEVVDRSPGMVTSRSIDRVEALGRAYGLTGDRLREFIDEANRAAVDFGDVTAAVVVSDAALAELAAGLGSSIHFLQQQHDELILGRNAYEAWIASGRAASSATAALGTAASDAAQAVGAAADTLGDLRSQGIDLADVFTVEGGDLFDFDFGSPKEWVAKINKELREANIDLRSFLGSKKAQTQLEAGVAKIAKRTRTLMNLTTKTADLGTAGGNLMTVFGASILSKTNKATGDVGRAMQELGLSGADDFAKGATPTTAQWLSTLPSSATIAAAWRSLGIAAKTGFLGGFGTVAGSAATPGVQSAGPVSIYVSGDPATIEASVLRALRRSNASNGHIDASRLGLRPARF